MWSLSTSCEGGGYMQNNASIQTDRQTRVNNRQRLDTGDFGVKMCYVVPRQEPSTLASSWDGMGLPSWEKKQNNGCARFRRSPDMQFAF